MIFQFSGFAKYKLKKHWNNIFTRHAIGEVFTELVVELLLLEMQAQDYISFNLEQSGTLGFMQCQVSHNSTKLRTLKSFKHFKCMKRL